MEYNTKTSKAAEMLGVHPQTVRAYASEGFLSYKTRQGERGRAKGLWFDRGEVEAFRDGGAPAAKAYRESKDQPASVKRGRGRKLAAK